MLSPTLESFLLKCIQICARFISWLYHIISTSHTRIQPSRVFPDLSLLLAVHNINRHFDEMKQHRADSLPLSHCHGEKANSVKFGSQQCWNAWLRIHFRSISLNSYSPLRRCCGAQSPCKPSSQDEKGLAITRKRWEARQLQWAGPCLQREFLL